MIAHVLCLTLLWGCTNSATAMRPAALSNHTADLTMINLKSSSANSCVVQQWAQSGLLSGLTEDNQGLAAFLVQHVGISSIPQFFKMFENHGADGSSDPFGNAVQDLPDDLEVQDLKEYLEYQITSNQWVMEIFNKIINGSRASAAASEEELLVSLEILGAIGRGSCTTTSGLQRACQEAIPEQLLDTTRQFEERVSPEGTVWRAQLQGLAYIDLGVHPGKVGKEVEIKMVQTFCKGGLCQLIFRRGVERMETQLTSMAPQIEPGVTSPSPLGGAYQGPVRSLFLLFMPGEAQRVAGCICYLRAAHSLGFRRLDAVWDGGVDGRPPTGDQANRHRAQSEGKLPAGWAPPSPELLGAHAKQQQVLWCSQNHEAMLVIPTFPNDRYSRPSLLPLWTFTERI